MKEFPQIIDNKSPETRLDSVLNDLILPFADEVRIAVGYFYISGFQLVLPGLQKNSLLNREKSHNGLMKFIISPRTDKLTGKTLIEGHRANSDANIEDIIYNILKTFEADLALTSTEAMDRVLALLVDQTLQIRLYVKDFSMRKRILQGQFTMTYTTTIPLLGHPILARAVLRITEN